MLRWRTPSPSPRSDADGIGRFSPAVTCNALKVEGRYYGGDDHRPRSIRQPGHDRRCAAVRVTAESPDWNCASSKLWERSALRPGRNLHSRTAVCVTRLSAGVGGGAREGSRYPDSLAARATAMPGNERSTLPSMVTSFVQSFFASATNSQSYAEHSLSRTSSRRLRESTSYSAPVSKSSA